MTRRQVITTATTATAAAATGLARALPGLERRRMGLVIHSYWKRWRGKFSSIKYPPFKDALDVLDHVRGLGVGALQIMVDGWTMEFARKVRATCESYGMALEGSIRLPRNESDVGRFESEIRVSKEAGASIFRCAMGGRRYELYTQRAEFEAWKESSLKSILLAEPVARRQQVRIGIENHKDLELHELVDALRKTSSPHIGSCIDTGNSIALLEDPMTVVRELAPFVVTSHLKDMAVVESGDGFLLSEVPLGQGSLDIPAMISAIQKANPQAGLHLEMITRDPLDIRCLTDGYWATFPNKPGIDMARTLRWVREHKADKLPRVSGLGTDAALAMEEENIVRCLTYAGKTLGMDHPEPDQNTAINRER